MKQQGTFSLIVAQYSFALYTYESMNVLVHALCFGNVRV